ncbi:hypothetical protein APR50_40835 [Variovorax paradoxus]|jgi:tripartite-type tricarboxylate transporter receptor subunit TctC|uniref:Bug family tripartite tricarboxylate transporter substrate binding protein n=1 Tax=Variovorax paradoxus TaxID=34073 RepID=UPI0006E6919E|nr:hypothetical protein APR52_41950 [Variovorax paradoxus]KPU91351.1 hypothetical protein APR50_40835 [Variovorax paradoxus]KPU95726.1 hypothetical protein APR49_37310 [Variovorax paradoxus]KPV14966.1 hypothetical protein APR51_36615 [Variovorax paradoxus]KPV19399.1 hypothetical protein APR48_39970 [Variovorax paradoxus]
MPTTTIPFNPRRRRALTIGAAAFLPVPFAWAQGYPTKPIRLILPNAPGSSVDNMARQLAVGLGTALGQSIVVENVPGSGGLIGISQMLRAPRDGYTIGMVANNYAIGPSLYRLPYDPTRDIVPVSLLVTGPMVLVTHPALPARTLADFIALAKSRPVEKSLSFGSAGVGTVGHLAGELMATSADVKLLHVPYKGNNNFTTDLVGGQLDAGFIAAGVAMPLVRQGSLRALALTTPRRLALLPEVAPMAEAGLPGFDLGGWQAMIAPAGIPAPALERLNAEIVRVLKSKEVSRFVEEQGSQVVASSPAEAGKLIARDIARYADLSRRIGLKPEN